MQSKLSSFMESIVNVIIGYWIAIGAQMILLPLLGIHMDLRTNLIFGLGMTVVSIVRSYWLRRGFNRWGNGVLISKVFNRVGTWLIERAMKTPYLHIPNYMERYWLKPYSEVRDSWAARIHHILSSDDARAFHDHPWPYITVILRGGYWEVKPVFKHGMYQGDSREWIGAGRILFRRANSWHRLEIEPGTDTWTLFITGKFRQKWGFLVSPAHKIYYRDYLGERATDGTPGA